MNGQARALEPVRAPALPIVDGDDTVVLDLDEQALRRLECIGIAPQFATQSRSRQ